MEILYYGDPTALNLIELTVWVNYYGFNLPYTALYKQQCDEEKCTSKSEE